MSNETKCPMTAEERFEAWWEGTGIDVYQVPVGTKQEYRNAWLACEAARDAEIERVTAVAKKNHDLAEECERKYYLEMNAKDDAQDDVAALTTQLATAVEALDEVQRLLLPMFDGMDHDDEDCPGDDTCECDNVACVNMVAAKVAEALRQIGANDGN